MSNNFDKLKEEEHQYTSDLLERVVQLQQADYVSIGELKMAMHERGFGVLMAIAALPLCIPFPAPPGYTTFFSIPLFILATQMMFGMSSPWLPKWILNKNIKRKTLALLVMKASGTLKKIEKLLKPRWSFAGSRTGEKIIGGMAFLFSIAIAIPLPLTNLPPGYGILIMSLGLLSKDGLTIIIGMFVGFIGMVITMIVLMVGGAAAERVIDAMLSAMGM
jgi:hypothetical protein